jgi:hypothetical protein
VQQTRGVARHIDRRDSAGQRNGPRTTSLVPGNRVISYGSTRSSMGISTHLLVSVDSVALEPETNRTHSTEARSG